MMDINDLLFARYVDANTYLNEGLIRTNPVITNLPRRCSWMPAFLDELENPQRGIPTVHIAGTSGKGTTALMIAEILRAAGFKTGLHISPYLQVSTEKIWIDGSYCDAELFASTVEDMKPVFERFRGPEIPIHGMASVAVALEIFRRQKVDIIVFETGVGGRFDLTNFLDTSLSVITKLGFDHQKALGETIKQIAWHKAGIIKPGRPCVALAHRGVTVIREEARITKSPLFLVKPEKQWQNARLHRDGTTFDYHGKQWRMTDVFTAARGPFQVENATLAVAAAETLNEGGFTITEKAVRMGLSRAFLPGRIEVISENPTVILDGAHNPDKMENLQNYLEHYRKPESTILICGLLVTKVKGPLITRIEKLADRVITTMMATYGKEPLDANALADLLRKRGVAHVTAVPDGHQAIREALRLATSDGMVIATGSLYLMGNLRNYWYPEKEVLLQKTSFPNSE